VRQTALAPCPEASAIAARATVTPPVIDWMTLSKLTPRLALRRLAGARRRGAAGLRAAGVLRGRLAAARARAGRRLLPPPDVE
jgi:hypothetical protein